jgi:hypothetical protein
MRKVRLLVDANNGLRGRLLVVASPSLLRIYLLPLPLLDISDAEPPMEASCCIS